MLAIRTENLSKTYRKRHLGRLKKTPALKKLNLEVVSGEIYGLLGPNGSGKTTAIKLLLGLLFPTEGEIYILEQARNSFNQQGKLGYLPELPYFYKYLTPREVLELYANISELSPKEKAMRIEYCLELVRMKEYSKQRMGEFSKGMLQRIGVAQSLLHNPQIIIYDEPISGLDPIGLKEMRELILRLKEEGKTVLFSSHIISQTEKICDRAGILVNGELKKVVEIKAEKLLSGQLEDIFVQVVQEGITA